MSQSRMTRKCHVRLFGGERVARLLATRFSLLEQKEEIEPELLEQIADLLKVPTEAIKNFDDETAIFNIQHNYEGSNNQGPNLNYQCRFNPIDKWVEAMDENKKLYEALLKSERDKVALLEKMLAGEGKK